MMQPVPNILYEDNHLLVVEKPVNVPVQADASGDPDLLSICKAYIKETYQKPGAVYLGLVHRLDRPVGGVLVFAKTSKAAARLSAQFRSRQAKKRYVAIVEGDANSRDVLEDWLLKDESTNTTHVVAEGTADAKLAKLSYETLARADGLSLLDVSLDTGRPHQIRVQLASRHLPILGDMRYHPNPTVGTQIRLWAYALTLLHPTLNEPLTFYSTPPWTEFPAVTALLPASAVCRGVYVDDNVLVVDKNRGVEVEEGLLAELSVLYEPLYPVHRLDANTEGLVLFARTDAMRQRLEKAFYHHETRKLYHAIVCGHPKDGRYTHYAVKDAQSATMHLCSAQTAGAVNMELALRVLDASDALSLVEITLFTGRTHQIRVQMAALGCPVLGDDKYGDYAMNKQYKRRTQCLLAKELTVLGNTYTSLRTLSLEAFR